MFGIGHKPMEIWCTISAAELDAIVQRLTQDNPRCGTIMIWGCLRDLGIIVPRRRVRESLLRTNRTLVLLRATITVARRVYNVASSNSLGILMALSDGELLCMVVLMGFREELCI